MANSVKNKLTVDEVKHVAQLANLPISDAEIEKFAAQLNSIVDLVSKLSERDTNSVPETSQVTGQVNVMREDEIDETRVFDQKTALMNGNRTHNGFFVVPKILD